MYKTMNGNKFMSINKYVNEVDESENSPENSQDSPRPAVTSTDNKKIASTSTSKKRRGVEKKVVSVPIKDIEGFRLKGDQMSAPPSDSWAWRKYGQKPIKGSPYPRAYYRCSSSKGCPARKQVERSKMDPDMLLVTYACEHNHPWPAASRNNHHRTTASAAATTSLTTSASEEAEDEEMEEEGEEEIQEVEEKKPIVNIPAAVQSQEAVPEFKFPNLPLSEFGWYTDFESTLESPVFTEDKIYTGDFSNIFTMREEDEPLFADLGELPECSTVFRRGMAGIEAEQPRHNLATTS